jgi:hypothetical protein
MTKIAERAAADGEGGGALVACAERERGRGGSAEGASERGEVGEQGAGLKRGVGAVAWLENAWTWARLRREIVVERLGTADRWGWRDRERKSGRGEKERCRQIGPTEQQEGEGKRGCTGETD